MLMKEMFTKAAVAGMGVVMTASPMTMEAFAAEDVHWDLDGTITSEKGAPCKLTKNADGSYNLEIQENDRVYLGFTSSKSGISFGKVDGDQELRDISAGASNDKTKVVISSPAGDGGSFGTLAVQPIVTNIMASNWGELYGNKVVLHVKVTAPEYILEEEYHNVEPFLRDGVAEPFVQKLNADRVKLGLGELKLNKELQILANRRAMEVKDNYVHTKVDGYGDYTECFIVDNGGTRMSAASSAGCAEACFMNSAGSKGDAFSETAKEIGVAQCVLGTNLALTVVIVR